MKKTYEILPFDPSADRAEILSDLMRKVAAHETFFSDYEGTCEEECLERDVVLMDLCGRCKSKMRTVASVLMNPSSRAWEVWRFDALGPEAVGLVLFSDVRPGMDLIGHYVFFDGRLSDKTPILENIISWAFEDHPEEGWTGVRRVTVEIPAPFAALARHASRKLGFGGGFKYNLNESTQLRVEGVKKDAVVWRGSLQDLLILGRLSEHPLKKHEVVDGVEDASGDLLALGGVPVDVGVDAVEVLL